jgi:dTDP-3-amino-2,3,6-trideoxy-4-keto-D-glucose/dTDP-3-amino-3,4,6-trideoxy-alpha-D-glucose/dTDP-2,6-dideoxy-D-kanosamine transaminase
MIKISDISARVEAHQEKINSAIMRVVQSGWFVLGPEVQRFERDFAAFHGVEHCISVANGTDALELALRAVGIGPGKTVATVANAGMYTTTAAQLLGAAPFFMDIASGERWAGAAQVHQAIAAGVDAVVITHLYGEAAGDIEEITALCKRANVPVVEDCAQAHGATIHGKRVGSFGDIATFSFYPTKNLGALGDGGAVLTGSDRLAKAVRALRQYGWSSKYRVEVAHSRNSRLDEMQAAVLSEFLPLLDEANAKRRFIARRYMAQMTSGKIVPPKAMDERHVAHLFVVECDDRESLRAHMTAHGIGCDVHYPIPDHRQPVLSERYAHISLPNTERLASKILTLPCYPEMTGAQVDAVISAFSSWQS